MGDKSLKNFFKMKFLGSLLAAFAYSNPVPAEDPAPASSDSGMSTDIIMINMNMANIQMNMGDFRGSDVPSEGMFNTNGTFQFLDGMSSSDRDQIKDFLAMDEVQSGLKTLAENLPGFQSFVDAMNGNTQTATTEATTTEANAGMGRKSLKNDHSGSEPRP